MTDLLSLQHSLSSLPVTSEAQREFLARAMALVEGIEASRKTLDQERTRLAEQHVQLQKDSERWKDRGTFESEREHFNALKAQTIADKRVAAAERKEAETVLATARSQAKRMEDEAAGKLAEAEAARAEAQADRDKLKAMLAEWKALPVLA